MHVCVTDAIQKDNRPEVSKRLFRSNAVEKEIIRVQKLLKNEKLAWMFANCFPNTTRHYRTLPQRRGWQTGYVRLYGRHSRHVAT